MDNCSATMAPGVTHAVLRGGYPQFCFTRHWTFSLGPVRGLEWKPDSQEEQCVFDNGGTRWPRSGEEGWNMQVWLIRGLWRMFCHKHISHVFKCKFAFVYQILYLPKYEPSIIASKKRLNFWTPKSPITAIRVKKWRKQKMKNSEAVFGYFLKKKLFPRFLLLWDVSTIYLG